MVGKTTELFIGSLPRHFNDSDLKKLFSEFNPQKITIPVDWDGEVRGFAFVRFSLNDAKNIISQFFFCDGRLLRIEVRHGYPNPEGDDAVKKKLSFNGNVNQHQGQRKRNTDNEGDEIKKRDSGAESREDDYDDLPELIEERDLKEKDGNDKNEESESEVEGKGQASESESESDSEDNEDHSDVEDEKSQCCPFELFHIAIIERQDRENNILIKKISSLEEEKRQLDQNISKKKEKLNTAKIQIVNLLSEIQNVKQSNHVLSKEVIKLSSAYKDLYSIYNEEKKQYNKRTKNFNRILRRSKKIQTVF